MALYKNGLETTRRCTGCRFLQNNNYIGRPADVMNMPDGSMLVSDDFNGAVYRVTYLHGSAWLLEQNQQDRRPPPQPAGGPVDEARIERARALVQQNHCNFCHTPNFAGQQNVPRIADQREDYLIKALRGYKDNSRRGYDPTMAETMAPISDDQILDLAYYIARVK